MRRLYHIWLDPGCRIARVVLAEKRVDFELKVEMPWQRRDKFLQMNPAGDVPLLIEKDGAILSNTRAVVEFLEEQYPEPPLLGQTPHERAEIRRLMGWFDGKFMTEVAHHLMSEKIMKRFLKMGQPSSDAIRAALYNMRTHLDYLDYLTERHNYLAGDRFSMADIFAASYFSVLDYLGDVDWDGHDAAREWYIRVKSRLSFKPLLEERISGLTPPRHYSQLDF